LKSEQSNGGVIQPAPFVLHPDINASQLVSSEIDVAASLQSLALHPTILVPDVIVSSQVQAPILSFDLAFVQFSFVLYDVQYPLVTHP
jgi:hypothetical protein